MEKLPVSVVVITKNEERSIAGCLKSAAWADELIVVDDYSTDNTANIARQFTEKVFSRKMEIEGAHRNYAYSLAKNKWVLSLDADELVSEELADELMGLFKGVIEDDAYTIPIRTYIGKRWIRHGGWYPAGKVRLFKKNRFRYEEAEVHPRVFIDGSYGYLTKDIIHHSYKDFHAYFQSLNNQTTLEARKWFKERRRIGFLKTCRKFIDRFLKSYILKQGFRDGLLGFMIAYGSGLYQLMSYVKYQEMLEAERLK
ncbi:MAG: glycosyltransferase family 2 protein [Candidatus Omnitrophica bacterium]|nr:glycosyltransferase family 2 protein [Candidatus Omnitrophota bacterium]MBI5144185.1 glycosyltransferase family 2 protein [Candidatus Omnitrophota bacterium]